MLNRCTSETPQIVARLAAAMIDHTAAAGCCLEDDLIADGFSRADIQVYRGDPAALARRAATRLVGQRLPAEARA